MNASQILNWLSSNGQLIVVAIVFILPLLGKFAKRIADSRRLREEKLRREKIIGKAKANAAHREVGAKVRQTIKELGGTMPEALPPADSIRKLESRQKRLGKGK